LFSIVRPKIINAILAGIRKLEAQAFTSVFKKACGTCNNMPARHRYSPRNHRRPDDQDSVGRSALPRQFHGTFALDSDNEANTARVMLESWIVETLLGGKPAVFIFFS
jgi:hypothetical protein